MNRLIEIRTYNLKPESLDDFHQLVSEQSIPMLKRWGVDVVAYGPSLQDDDTYFLIRSYASLDDLQQSQDAFYGSAKWREGIREPIVALIEHNVSVVLEVDDITLQGLRRSPTN